MVVWDADASFSISWITGEYISIISYHVDSLSASSILALTINFDFFDTMMNGVKKYLNLIIQAQK